MRILAPCEYSVILAENCRNCNGVLLHAVEFIYDENAGVLLVGFIDFFLGKASYTGDFAVEVIGVGSAVAQLRQVITAVADGANAATSAFNYISL